MTRARLRSGRAVGYRPTAAEYGKLPYGGPDDLWPGTIVAVRPDGTTVVSIERPDGKRLTRNAVMGNLPGQIRFDLTLRSTNPDVVSKVDEQAPTGRVDFYVAPNHPNANDGHVGISSEAPWSTLDRAIREVQSMGDIKEGAVVIHLASGTYLYSESLHEITLRYPVVIIGDGAEQDGDDGFTELATGTVTAGTGGTVLEIGGGLTADEFAGKTVEMTSGAALGYRRTVRNNTTTTIYPSLRFYDDPSDGDTFRIVEPAVIFQLPSAPGVFTDIQDYCVSIGSVGRAGNRASIHVENSLGMFNALGFLTFMNIRFVPENGVSTFHAWGINDSAVLFYGCEWDTEGVSFFNNQAGSFLGCGSEANEFGRERSYVPWSIGLIANTWAWSGWGLTVDGAPWIFRGASIRGILVGLQGLGFRYCRVTMFGGSAFRTGSAGNGIEFWGSTGVLGPGSSNDVRLFIRCETTDGADAAILSEGGSKMAAEYVTIERANGRTAILAEGSDISGGDASPSWLSIYNVDVVALSPAPLHMMAVSNGGVIAFRAGSQGALSGEALGGQPAAVYEGRLGGALIEEGVVPPTIGVCLPSAGVSDGRHGFIRAT